MINSQLVKHQERLVDLLSFARRHVPFYRRAIPSNIKALVSDTQQWQQMPMIDKRQVQTNWTDFLSSPDAASDPGVDILVTSGSTGTPLKIARPKSELRAQTKRLWATRARWHQDIMRWKLLSLYRHGIESPHKKELLLSKEDYIDHSFHALARYTDLVDQFKPDWMYGPVSAVYRWTQYYHQEQQSIPSLKFIEVDGQQLFDYQRALIELTFGCPVANQYGCREFWVLSYECPAKSMHAWTDDLLLEVIQDGKPVPPGEVGELVVTSLTNRVMPLIRYKLGDLVKMFPSSCVCGDPHPILTPIGGRVESLVHTRHKTITTSFINFAFSSFILHHDHALLEFQVVQTDYDHFEIHLVPGKGFDERVAFVELERDIRSVLPEIKCTFIVGPTITADPSGKISAFVSHVGPIEPTSHPPETLGADSCGAYKL